MKRYILLITVFLLAAGVGEAKANILSDIIGNWKFQGVVYQNNSKIANASGSTRITKFGKKGFYWVSTVKVGNQPSATSYTWMNDNGTLSGYAMQGSQQTSYWSGNWRAANNQFTYDMSVSSSAASFSQSVRWTRNNKKRLTGTSTTSIGLRLDGTLTK